MGRVGNKIGNLWGISRCIHMSFRIVSTSVLIWDEDSVDLNDDAMIFLYDFPSIKSWPNEYVNNIVIDRNIETQYILTKSIKP